MPKTARVNGLLSGLRKQWPKPICEVNHKTPLQLMVGVILSAQSTDKRVNEITPALFEKYPTARALAQADTPELENDIRSSGFFRNKARSIRMACALLVEKFNSQMPRTMNELLELPGIGRKSANVILGACFGVSSGVVVDTHMTRLAHRLRLSKEKDPVKIEKDLMEVIPAKEWIFFSQSMVLHGRYICLARTPRCWECELIKVCPFADKVLAPREHEPATPRKTITGLPIHTRR